VQHFQVNAYADNALRKAGSAALKAFFALATETVLVETFGAAVRFAATTPFFAFVLEDFFAITGFVTETFALRSGSKSGSRRFVFVITIFNLSPGLAGGETIPPPDFS
jgi:hypothetical protein